MAPDLRALSRPPVAIDSGDYATAFEQYTAQTQAAETESSFVAADASSYDYAAVLNSVTTQSPGVDIAWVSFTSLQSASQGPNGDTCDIWSLDYTMDQVDGAWLIESASGHDGGAANTTCS